MAVLDTAIQDHAGTVANGILTGRGSQRIDASNSAMGQTVKRMMVLPGQRGSHDTGEKGGKKLRES
jgi:hypothetical protein